jgi:KDO2-lipid IV(A) lauroyltransferase
MFERIAYYLLVFPLSLLPLRLLYLFTDFFYLILILIVPYRRTVIRKNLSLAFPKMSEKEKRKLERKFYRHFTDLLAEAVKNLTISKMELKKRINVVNRDYIDQLYIQGKSVLFVGAHYNNWEWIISAQNFLFAHQAVGIGAPMTSKFWDKKVNQRRARFRMKITHAKNFKEVINETLPEPISLLVLADQSPADGRKSYWTKFFNQTTAFFFGAELIAHEYGFPVVYLKMNKVKRGFYELSFETISETPKNTKYGEITDKHVEILHKVVSENPTYWIWTHKRWKRDIPDDLDELKKIQREKFNSRFKS